MLVMLPAGWLFAGCDDEDTGIGPRADGAVDGPPTPDAAAVDAAGDGPAADTTAPADAGPGVDAPMDASRLPFLMFTSSTDQAHAHAVTLEVASLMMPPSGGVSRDTSLAGQHVHTVVLTQGELQAIEAGQTVSKATSVVGAHSHTFQFSKATGMPVATG